jgi:hypothetical protein
MGAPVSKTFATAISSPSQKDLRSWESNGVELSCPQFPLPNRPLLRAAFHSPSPGLMILLPERPSLPRARRSVTVSCWNRLRCRISVRETWPRGRPPAPRSPTPEACLPSQHWVTACGRSLVAWSFRSCRCQQPVRYRLDHVQPGLPELRQAAEQWAAAGTGVKLVVVAFPFGRCTATAEPSSPRPQQ